MASRRGPRRSHDRRRARVEKRHEKQLQVGVEIPTKHEIRAILGHAGRLLPFLVTGRPENLQNTELGWRRSAETRRARAGALATDLLPIIEAIQAEGITSFGGIAKVLNDRGIPTARGSRWQAVQVQRVVQAATSALAQSGIAPSPSPLSDPKLG